MRAGRRAPRPVSGRSFAGVGYAVSRVDLADDFPEVLVVHLDELLFAGLREFLLQGRAFPLERKEGIADRVLQFGLQIVDNTEPGRREGL